MSIGTVMSDRLGGVNTGLSGRFSTYSCLCDQVEKLFLPYNKLFVHRDMTDKRIGRIKVVISVPHAKKINGFNYTVFNILY